MPMHFAAAVPCVLNFSFTHLTDLMFIYVYYGGLVLSAESLSDTLTVTTVYEWSLSLSVSK